MRRTLEALHEEGRETPDDFMASKPEVLSWAQDLYLGFFECDRDFNGNLLFRGMNAVLDEQGITDAIERQEIRFLWRSMDAARREQRDEMKGEDK